MFEWISRLLARHPKPQDPGVAASTPSTHRFELRPTPTDTCAIEDKNGPEVEYQCGHRHAECFTLNLFGDRTVFTNDSYFAEREVCPECRLDRLRPSIIHCVHCGFGIMPGDNVMLYVDHDRFKKEWKTTVDEGTYNIVIGCRRWSCCESLSCYGYWMGDCFVPISEAGSNAKAHKASRFQHAVFARMRDEDEMDH